MTEGIRFISADHRKLDRFDADSFWQTFQHGSALVNGVNLHYVEGGTGAPVLLIPGWPQSWYAWRYVMPLLVSAGRRVVALDPRGMGDSDHPQTGYDMTSAAADVHGLVESIGLTDSDSLDVVGHDVGSWIGYAYASDWPKDVKRLTVLDAALPGITLPPPPGIPSAESNVKTWHFAFNRLDDLPEILIRGREREFLTWLFRSKATRAWTIDSNDLEEYIRVNATPGALRAAGSYYRSAFSPEGIAQNRARAEKLLTIPVLAFGSEMGTGDGMLRAMQQVTIAAQGGVFKGIGHYIPEECPQLIADELVAFFQKADF